MIVYCCANIQIKAILAEQSRTKKYFFNKKTLLIAFGKIFVYLCLEIKTQKK